MNARRGWLGHFNQFPIIAGVNDRVHAVHLNDRPKRNNSRYKTING